MTCTNNDLDDLGITKHRKFWQVYLEAELLHWLKEIGIRVIAGIILIWFWVKIGR